MLVNVSSVKKSEKGIEEDRWGQAAPVFSGRRGECEPGERKGWGGFARVVLTPHYRDGAAGRPRR